MSSHRDHPLARFSALVWGIGTFLIFAIGLAVVWHFSKDNPSSLEDEAATKRYATKATTFAAQDAALTYKEVEAGKKVSVPPHDVYGFVGKKLAETKAAAVEKDEQRHPDFPKAEGPKSDFDAINAMGPKAGDPINPADMEAGKAQYMMCAACHGQNGEGTPAAPAHAGAEWITGPVSNLILIQFRGLQGPIHVKGQKFETVPMMAPMGYQTDEQIAHVLTYVRNSFGNKASAVSVEQVKALRGEVGKAPVTEADLIKP